MAFSPTDTIVAIATPGGRGAIGVVRVSGPRALEIAGSMLALPHPLEPRRATLTRVVCEPDEGVSSAEPELRGSLAGVATSQRDDEQSVARPPKPKVKAEVDEVIATFFPAPHSYTTEDVVELSCHGSPALLREIVRVAMNAGARLAEPGEFTFRAFLGGRIDLVQAEAISDLVDAVTPLQARVAFDQLEGTLTRAIARLDAQLFDLVTKLEASIDFPEEGYHFIEPEVVAASLREVRAGIEDLLGTARTGRLIREGRQLAIVGKPNVGKSSLFNWLVGTDRAIVTALPGTTRDLLHETIDLDGIRLGLVDTAGIRDAGDAIEQEGVARARRAKAVADVVCVVLDASRPIDSIDREILDATRDAHRVVIANKIDLPRSWSAAALAPIEISLTSGAGLPALRLAIKDALEFAEPRRDEPLITNVRHEALLRDARESIDRAIAGIEQAGESLNEELVLADLAGARRAFDEVVGKRTSDDVLRAIFERFCIGK